MKKLMAIAIVMITAAMLFVACDPSIISPKHEVKEPETVIVITIPETGIGDFGCED